MSLFLVPLRLSNCVEPPLMLNPELELTNNLCLKSVALLVLIHPISMIELHNFLFLRIYVTGLLLAAVN